MIRTDLRLRQDQWEALQNRLSKEKKEKTRSGKKERVSMNQIISDALDQYLGINPGQAGKE